MAYYGNGFTVMELYKLPTHLRNFYFKMLADAKKKENAENEEPALPNITNPFKKGKVRIK